MVISEIAKRSGELFRVCSRNLRRDRRESRCGDDAAVSGHQDDLERGNLRDEADSAVAKGGFGPIHAAKHRLHAARA